MNLRVKLGDRKSARLVDFAVRRMGGRLRSDGVERNYGFFLAARPENAMPRAIALTRPEVVVVNSIDLPAWRQLRNDLQRMHMPVALYLREETGLLHLSHSRVPPDLVLANATGHRDAAQALGYDAVLIPSVINCKGCDANSTRERVLFVNPTAMYGLDVALALAEARPDIPFAFAESIALDDTERTRLRAEGARLANIELRPFTNDLRVLYGDVRVLLAPYRYPGRSRVISEAQCNGIPTLASNLYGLAEAVGDAGIVADPDGPIQAWHVGLAGLWDDPDLYARLSERARARSVADDRDPDAIAAKLESTLAGLVAAGSSGGIT